MTIQKVQLGVACSRLGAEYSGHNCSAYIMKSGWTIPDNYSVVIRC